MSMNKKNIIFQCLVGGAGLTIHYWLLSYFGQMPDRLWAFYLFFLTFSLFTTNYSRYQKNKNPERVGLVIIGLIVFKILLFMVIFSPLLLGDFETTQMTKINILVPFALFLALEVHAVLLILNQN